MEQALQKTPAPRDAPSLDPQATVAIDLRFRRGRSRIWLLAVVPGTILLLLVIVAPMIYMARYGVVVGIDRWWMVLGQPPGSTILVRTVLVAVQVTLVCGLLGYLYAAALVAAGPRLRMLLFALVFVPFLTSVLVRTYAWMILLGKSGPLSALQNGLFDLGLIPTADGGLLYNRFAVLVGMVNMMLPLFVLPLYSVMSKLSPQLAPAARTMGANRVGAFFRITLPLSAPGAAAGATVVFTLSLGFLITPQLLGGTDDLMIAQYMLIRLHTFADLTSASLLAIGLILLVAVIVALFRVFYPIENLVVAGAGQQARRRGIRRSGAAGTSRPDRGRWWRILVRSLSDALAVLPWGVITKVLALVLGVFLAAPLLITIPVSFTNDGFLSFPPSSYSFRWYAEVLGDPGWITSLGESLKVAALATVLSLVVGLPIAFFIASAPVSQRVRSIVLVLSILPVLIPVIVLATGTYVWFLQIGAVGNVFALAAAHSTLGIPFMVVVVVSALRDFDRRTEMAARTLGASAPRTFLAITLPLLRPAILTGVLFAFLQSFDELFIALVLASPTAPTLPIKMWLATTENISPALAVVSNVFILFTLVVLGLLMVFSRTRKNLKKASR